jgi:hypothetical protein
MLPFSALLSVDFLSLSLIFFFLYILLHGEYIRLTLYVLGKTTCFECQGSGNVVKTNAGGLLVMPPLAKY